MDKPWLIVEYFISPRFLQGAAVTLWITIVSLFFGIIVGLIIALFQESKSRPLKALAVGYLWFFRGTPALFQIIFVFNVLPQFGITLSNFLSGVVALSMNEGAYMAEIIRSGLESVGRGQRTAARALGMRERQVLRHIVLPQALRIIIPPTGNQFIGMLKLSALVSVVAVEELLLVANQSASANFRYLEHVSAGLNRGFPNVCGFGRLMALIRDEGAIDAETMFSGFARARAGSGGSGSVAARGGGIL